MKTVIQRLPPAGVFVTENGESETDQPQAVNWSLELVDQSPAKPFSTKRAWASPVQCVGILAFIQSLVFLAIWLLICASAGAGTIPQSGFNADLQKSVYKPAKQRDPFNLPGVTAPDSKVVPAASIALHLEGILYQPGSPSAIVNGALLPLNKAVVINDGTTEIQVKATEITRNRVVLETDGQKVELLLKQEISPQNKQ